MGVARGMKAGKEEIAGLVKAVELYLKKNHVQEMQIWESRVAYILDASRINGKVSAYRRFPYGIGQQIPHAAIRWDERELGINLEDAVSELYRGTPRIAVQLLNEGNDEHHAPDPPHIRVHPHTLTSGQEYIVARRLIEVLS